jgi:hypothetical protein
MSLARGNQLTVRQEIAIGNFRRGMRVRSV